MDKKTKFAIFLTVLWVLGGCITIYMKADDFEQLRFNEIGDFMAGFFSPVAFLWLVFGYFQQSEELNLNTKALELQVQELRQSVRQQQELVQLSRDEYMLSKAAHDREAESIKYSIQPIFRILGRGGSSGSNGVQWDYLLENIGHTATKVELKNSCGEISPNLVVAAIGRDQPFHFRFSCKEPRSDIHLDITISCLDGHGKRRHYITNINGAMEPSCPVPDD